MVIHTGQRGPLLKKIVIRNFYMKPQFREKEKNEIVSTFCGKPKGWGFPLLDIPLPPSPNKSLNS